MEPRTPFIEMIDIEEASPSALTVSHLALSRGLNCLYHDLSFTLEPGALLWLQGQNGSGKTSLLRALAGLLKPDEGTWLWDKPVFYLGTRSLGFHPALTVFDNLRCMAKIFQCDLHLVLESPFMQGLHRDSPMHSLSSGQHRRAMLAFLNALYAPIRPLWLLDEPLTALDRTAQRLLENSLNTHLGAQGLVIMSSHEWPSHWQCSPSQHLTLSHVDKNQFNA